MEQQGLYRSEYEHDACGVGMVANLSGEATHGIVVQGMAILKRLMHRGATGNDPKTGDGAGLLMKIPRDFFAAKAGALRNRGGFAVAMIFGGENEEKSIEAAVANEGCRVLAWRDVPVDPSAIGRDARSVMPRIRQLFIDSTDEKRLYIIRRQIEKTTKNTYVCSCSARTIVYKGLLLATQIEKFYPDLSEAAFVSPFAIVHQRYSTNTFPSWELAHPFRAIAHNGEINAIKGNLIALTAREKSLLSDVFGEELQKVLPVVHGGQSDSASLDNIFELLVAAGRDAPHAMMMLVPQAWGAKYHVGHDVRAFYEYHSALMEPWDGPATVAFTDGVGLGAALDRNGLRPARWTLTKDGLFVLASEAGVLDIPPEAVARHGRLRPGSLVWLDLEKHRLMEDTELKTFYARQQPYRRWVKENQIPVTGLFTDIVPSRIDGLDLDAAQRAFGWTLEDVELVVRPMAETGHEPVGAMGNDAALAALSQKPRLLFDYFHQLFAQVTNPPIDPIREELVMSIMTYIGNEGNILAETPEHARLVKMTRPVLTDDELSRLENIPSFPATKLKLFFEGDLESALDALAAAALKAVEDGAKIIVLSDNGGAAAKRIPSLLATAAVNKALVKAGARPSAGIVVESGEVREVHHFAVLLGFGATAINPYLALAAAGATGGGDRVRVTANYVGAVCAGIRKIMSKMGISTLRSYRSARMFEAVGLGPRIVGEYFEGVASPVGGLELEDLEKKLCASGGAAAPGGECRLRKDGEEHLWTPQRIVDFREAVRRNDYERFKRYTDGIDSESRVTLRSQLEFKAAGASGGCEPESIEAIAKHFVGGAMSLGSLSPETHETIALALNGLGTMSNSGEGGENPERFGTDRNSAIKQIASGRFGVTIEYIRSAKDLQIKLAQGAKPGEGGQLPGDKVDAFVGRLRHAKPGTTLISPPPHHDIYSIEDLAQLIYDLKCANPAARISVKLVSEAGVGTIAAGVAKAHADVIVISGFDGGTGAAPLTSMKHAGLPWEPGLAEAHQTLLKNNLRDRVKLQVDGQLRTGRDIAIAAMLGADEFAFGTSMLVSLGCVQCRNCNLNCCPVGIATQKEELRAKFAGRPEHLQRYFRFLAAEVREHLAALGVATLAELRGRTDLLKAKEGSRFDFAGLLAKEEASDIGLQTSDAESPEAEVSWLQNYDARELIPSVERGERCMERNISNCDRAVGAALSGWLVGKNLGKIEVSFTGTAGQSFGAFLHRGVVFHLQGEANDYVGKGLSGGIISITGNAGNVIAYGATSGAIFIGGTAGERFGIRNSGATLIVEGAGDHALEYMTGGFAVILGPVGVNFAAGMTGGTAYVYDRENTLDLNSNLDSVDFFPVEENSPSEKELLSLLKEHLAHTLSAKAEQILADWTNERHFFAKVVPAKPRETHGAA